jgi:DNA helicase HerA-like ATPase
MTDLGDFSSDLGEDDGTDVTNDLGEDDGTDVTNDLGEDGGTDVTNDLGEDDGTDVTSEREESDDDGPTESDDFEEYDATPAGRDRGIGVLSAASGLRISEEDDETSLRAYVTANNRSGIRIGSYLLASYPDGERLFCRISALEYAQEYRADDATEIHARRAMRSDGIDEEDFKLMATLDPVAVLYEEGGELKRRMTDRVPKPETVISVADDKEEIKTGLKMPSKGVFLGHLSVGGQRVQTAAEPPTIDYRLKDDYTDGDPLVFRHTLVAGGTGSGKTHASKNVLRQYLDEDRAYPVDTDSDRTIRPAVVQFDPQDEYAQMHDDGEYDDEFARNLDAEGIAHGGVDDTLAFVPKVGSASYAASHHRAEQVEFTIPFEMVHDNPWLIASSGLNDNQYGALVNVLLKRFRRQYGREGTYDQFQSFLDDPALREELDESGKVHEATFDAVKRRARGFGPVFDQDAAPITEQIGEFVRPGGLTVVPTYHISESRYAETVVLALSSLLVDQKLSNDPDHGRIKDTPLIVGMDEAHNFLTDADTVQAQQVIGKFTEAAKQGRKERLGLFLITQDPQDIADPVFKQINTTVVLNLGDEDAISAVNIPSNLESKVPYMEKGQMVVYSPDNSEPVELIGLPNCLTRHGRD